MPKVNRASVITALIITMFVLGCSDWAIIPKAKNRSEVLSDINPLPHNLFQILPLPTVSIVGKGVVIDLEQLQKGLPTYARGNHKIPVDYEFPLRAYRHRDGTLYMDCVAGGSG